MYGLFSLDFCLAGREKIRLTSLLLFACIIVCPGPLRASDKDLEALVAEALENNSELLALEERAEALQLEAPFFGSLQDPMVGIGLLNLPVDSFDLDQEAMTQKQLFLSQKIPWFGTLQLREQSALTAAFEAGQRARGARLLLRQQVADQWYKLGIARRSQLLLRNLQNLITQSLRIAESRYSTGKGRQQDILSGQVKLSELFAEDVGLKAQINAGQARLGILLNRPTRVVEEGPVLVGVMENELVQLQNQELLSMALSSNPFLQEKVLAVDRAKLDLELAERAHLPNFDLRLSYGQREENPVSGEGRADFLSAVVGMSIPLYKAKRQDSKLRGAQKRTYAAQRTLEGFRLNLPHEIENILAEINGYHEKHLLFRDALTIQAAHLAEASLAAYSAGEVEFDTMLNAQMKLLRVEEKVDVMRFQIYRKMTELERLVGAPLSIVEEAR
jgi:cobalt-zinc-cadmium efflux system outer membrane protein